MLPIAVFGFLGALAFWATMFAAPNDAIRLGLLCGIGATILLLGFLVFVVGRHLFGEPWLLGIGACAVSSAIVAATYLAKGGRPRLRSSGEEVDDQQGR